MLCQHAMSTRILTNINWNGACEDDRLRIGDWWLEDWEYLLSKVDTSAGIGAWSILCLKLNSE